MCAVSVEVRKTGAPATSVARPMVRVTVPAILREYAGLSHECTVIGSGSRLEIWDSAAWEAYVSAHEDDFANQSEEVVPGL